MTNLIKESHRSLHNIHPVFFGWWPACIYDPRLTVGSARKLALKNIGKKHLVYFFGCADAPFTVLTDAKCMAWEDGLMEELDCGKVAKNVSKSRAVMFQWALQAAIAEHDKPIEYRLDWNHEEDPFVIEGANGNSGGGVGRPPAADRASAGNGVSCIPVTTGGGGGKKRNMEKQNNNTTQRDKKRIKDNNNLGPTRRSNRGVKPFILILMMIMNYLRRNGNFIYHILDR